MPQEEERAFIYKYSIKLEEVKKRSAIATASVLLLASFHAVVGKGDSSTLPSIMGLVMIILENLTY